MGPYSIPMARAWVNDLRRRLDWKCAGHLRRRGFTVLPSIEVVSRNRLLLDHFHGEAARYVRDIELDRPPSEWQPRLKCQHKYGYWNKGERVFSGGWHCSICNEDFTDSSATVLLSKETP